MKADTCDIDDIQSTKLIEWRNELDETLREATTQMHPILMGHALVTRVSVSILELCVFKARRVNEFLAYDSEEVIRASMADAEKALKIYKNAKMLQSQLNASMLLADLFELSGSDAAAKSIAAGVLPKAEAMEYKLITLRAQSHLNEDTLLKRNERKQAEIGSEDDDVLIANLDDDTVKQLAANSWRNLRLPFERLAIVEREWFSMRDISRERLRWCKDIELLQQLNHTKSLSTYFAVDPNRHCYCHKHRYESAVGNPDWEVLIQAFKHEYCLKCSDRTPKNI